MLCQKCWKEEATIHFTTLGADEAHERTYCLSCAHDEHLSWLLVWGYGLRADGEERLRQPELLPASPSRTGDGLGTLVATGMARCACGCRVVAGAQLPCAHGTFELLDEQTQLVEYICHCGRELRIPVPVVYCPICHELQADTVVATAETCLWNEQRRRIVAVDHDMRGGRITWGTFAILN